MLEASGVHVTEFATATAALAHWRQTAQDCSSPRLEMPGMDGGALIAAVQARGLAQRIVLISGRSVDYALLACTRWAWRRSRTSRPLSLATIRRLVAG
jgi:CheY-like chemotaxis protein